MPQDTFTITGKIHEVLPVSERGNFRTRQVVLEVPGYKDKTETPVFEFFGDRCDSLDKFQFGDRAEIKFNVKGRQWKDRYFTTLAAFSITHVGSAGTRESSPRRETEGCDTVRRPPEREPAYEEHQRRRQEYRRHEPEDDIDF